jgi:hypothetical protein
MKKQFIILFFIVISFQNSFGKNYLLTLKLEKNFIFNDSITIDNAYFLVTKNGTNCSKSFTENYRSRVIVALDKLKIKSSNGIFNLKRGEIAVFLESESYESPIGSFFEVAFKKNHPELKQPEKWVEPLKNKMIYDDAEFRVFEERLNPGDIRELHSHAQRVVVRLNTVQLTDPRFHPEGKVGTGIQVENTAKFAEPMVHVTKNLSKIPLFNIVIEFKIPHQ